MYNRITIFLFSMLFCSFYTDVQAQQDPVYTQFTQNLLPVNPAVAGTKENIYATGLVRRQWNGFQEAPSLRMVSMHAPLNYNRLGIGLNLTQETLGSQEQWHVQPSFSYKIRFSNSHLAMGINTGIRQYQTGTEGLNIQDQDDPVVTRRKSKLMLDIGTGIFWYADKFFAGLSILHLNEPSIQFLTLPVESVIKRNYLLMGQYQFQIAPEWFYIPSSLVRFVSGDAMTAQFQNRLSYNKHWFLGGGFTNSLTANIQTGGRIDPLFKSITGPLRISYAYHYGFNRFQQYHNGSHEITLSYHFKFRPSPEKIRERDKNTSPVYF